MVNLLYSLDFKTLVHELSHNWHIIQSPPLKVGSVSYTISLSHPYPFSVQHLTVHAAVLAKIQVVADG